MVDIGNGATFREEHVRAHITLGGISVYTPNVLSFSVNRSRKQMCATFSASLKINYTDLSVITGSRVVIRAGTDRGMDTIFTGYVEKASISPIRTDASKVNLSISGRDVFARLDGKTVTRRAADTSLPLFAVVSSVTRRSKHPVERFKTRVYSSERHTIIGLPDDLSVVKTAPLQGLNREMSNRIIGGLEISKMPSSDSNTSNTSNSTS